MQLVNIHLNFRLKIIGLGILFLLPDSTENDSYQVRCDSTKTCFIMWSVILDIVNMGFHGIFFYLATRRFMDESSWGSPKFWLSHSLIYWTILNIFLNSHTHRHMFLKLSSLLFQKQSRLSLLWFQTSKKLFFEYSFNKYVYFQTQTPG